MSSGDAPCCAKKRSAAQGRAPLRGDVPRCAGTRPAARERARHALLRGDAPAARGFVPPNNNYN
jgi:hypothetical protein